MILRVAIPTPLRRIFDYKATQAELNFVSGLRVKVPFGKKEVIGIILEVTNKSDFPLEKIKPIIECLDTEPLLPLRVFELALWAADYYQYPVGEVLASVFPSLVRKGKSCHCEERSDVAISKILAEPSLKTLLTSGDPHVASLLRMTLNQEQSIVTNAMKKNLTHFNVSLLQGVTGSGKTEVYLSLLDMVIAQGKQALILVPEIGLTPQTVERFTQRFGDIVGVYHSGLTEKNKFNTWFAMLNGTVSILIGTRSAVFAPLKNLGIIIIDECHDASFKQWDGFKYHARDTAIRRAQLENIPIMLGSATPSLETLLNVEQGRYQRFNLHNRAGNAIMPHYHLINLKKQNLIQGFAPSVLQRMREHLSKGNQVLVFLNRRGFAPVLLCHECGHITECSRCNAPMTVHHSANELRCHHCGKTSRLPKKCTQCHSEQFIQVGIGTERVEHFFETAFSNYVIERVDRDTTRKKDSLNKKLAAIHSGQAQLLIGTQMLTKGHHFPNVTLVVVLDADGGLYSADFRATERLAQLLVQVAGRAGREEKPGEVLIQTHHPEHVLLQHLITEGYGAFAQQALREREAAQLPPYSYFVLFRAESLNEVEAKKFLSEVKTILLRHVKEVTLLGPAIAPIEKRDGRYRWQLLLSSKKRAALQHLLKKSIPDIELLKTQRKVRWSIDVDPMELS